MNILLTENNFLFSNIKIHENLSVSSSLPGHTALWCEPERSLPGKCSATASGKLWFSFTNNDTHQLRTDRCQDDRAALFCFGKHAVTSWPSRKRKKWAEASPGRRHATSLAVAPVHTHVKCHRPERQCGCQEDDAPSGWQLDKKAELYCSTRAAWHELLATPTFSLPLSLSHPSH